MRGTGFGFSAGLVMIGAILALAVDADIDGFDINTAGVIVFVVGIVLAVVSLAPSSRRQVVETSYESAPARRWRQLSRGVTPRRPRSSRTVDGYAPVDGYGAGHEVPVADDYELGPDVRQDGDGHDAVVERDVVVERREIG